MKNNNGLSIALGVCGIVISIIGGMTFGIIGAIIGLGCSVGGIILGINTQKATGGAQGKGGFICGIIGAVFGFVLGGLAIFGGTLATATGEDDGLGITAAVAGVIIIITSIIDLIEGICSVRAANTIRKAVKHPPVNTTTEA